MSMSAAPGKNKPATLIRAAWSDLVVSSMFCGVVMEAALSASGKSCLVMDMTELSGSRHFGEAEPALNFDLWPIYQMSKLDCDCSVNISLCSEQK